MNLVRPIRDLESTGVRLNKALKIGGDHAKF